MDLFRNFSLFACFFGLFQSYFDLICAYFGLIAGVVGLLLFYMKFELFICGLIVLVWFWWFEVCIIE